MRFESGFALVVGAGPLLARGPRVSATPSAVRDRARADQPLMGDGDVAGT